MSTSELARPRLPSTLVGIGSLLIVAALVMVIFRVDFTQKRTLTRQSADITEWHIERNERSELTLLWCASTFSLLGVGIILIGCARWPAR